MIKILSISTILVFFSISCLSQTAENDSIPKEKLKIDIVKDSRIDKLNNTYTESFKLDGYRIQILSDNKKQPVRQARMQFVKIYRKTKAYEIYEQPYFKLRVGDFKTKIEALKFKNDLTKHFPNCFIVKDEIEFDD